MNLGNLYGDDTLCTLSERLGAPGVYDSVIDFIYLFKHLNKNIRILLSSS